MPVPLTSLLLAAAAWAWQRVRQKARGHLQLALKALEPSLTLNQKGQVQELQAFGDYVVKQIGLEPSHPAAKPLGQVAEKYVRGDKTTSDTSRADVLALVEEQCECSSIDLEGQLAKDLIVELDACILAYFGFHWHHAKDVLDTVLNGNLNSLERRRSSLKKAVLEITRSQRYQKVLEVLGPQRHFLTLVEQLKGLHPNSPSNGGPNHSEHEGGLFVPAEEGFRSPVVLFVGGGMGAGKSTVVRDVMRSAFWKKFAPQAVLVEADAFKEKDVVYQKLTELEGGANPEVAALVHSSSVKAALSLFVAAVNEGRDVIFDGTMSWQPFVKQCVEMVRDAHRRRYCLGPGYVQHADGTVTEKYWEVTSVCTEEGEKSWRPYRVEMVGVACDAGLSVVRGMRRAILTGRGVPVESQLRSHRLFAAAFEEYIPLMDRVTLYMTNSFGGDPDIIALKDGPGRRLLVDPPAYIGFHQLRYLNEKANCCYELYGKRYGHGCGGQADTSGFGGAWAAHVLCTERNERHKRLREYLTQMKCTALDRDQEP